MNFILKYYILKISMFIYFVSLLIYLTINYSDQPTSIYDISHHRSSDIQHPTSDIQHQSYFTKTIRLTIRFSPNKRTIYAPETNPSSDFKDKLKLSESMEFS